MKSPRSCMVYLLLAQVIIVYFFFSFVSLPPPTPPTPTSIISSDSSKGSMKLHEYARGEMIVDDRSFMCLRQSGLAPAGGIETWFWTMAKYVLNEYPLQLYALSLVRPYWIQAWFYGKDTLSEVLDNRIVLNADDDRLAEECDIVVTTGVYPMPQPLRLPSVLLVHGSGDEWTQKYTRFLPTYDAIVCVSLGCETHYKQTAKDLNIPMYTVPSAVNKDLCPKTHKPREEVRTRWGIKRKKVLGFLGRISPEKNPGFFVDVVNNLPKEWEGVMAGPLYWEVNLPDLGDRTTYLGYENACDFLAAVDAVLLPSDLEGGPIVLLEAWSMRTPFFMRMTGLATAHPDAVQVIGTDAAETAVKIHNFVAPNNHDSMVEFMERGYKILDKYYTTTAVHKLWENVVGESIARKQQSLHMWRFPIIPIRQSEDNTEEFQVERLGRVGLIRCHNFGSCQTLFNITSPSPSSLSFNPTHLFIEYKATSSYSNVEYAGGLKINSFSSSSSSSSNYHHTLSLSKTPVQLCFKLSGGTPPNIFEVMLKSNQEITTKILEIALVDSSTATKSCTEKIPI